MSHTVLFLDVLMASINAGAAVSAASAGWRVWAGLYTSTAVFCALTALVVA